MVWRQQGLGRICAPAKVASGSAERGVSDWSLGHRRERRMLCVCELGARTQPPWCPQSHQATKSEAVAGRAGSGAWEQPAASHLPTEDGVSLSPPLPLSPSSNICIPVPLLNPSQFSLHFSCPVPLPRGDDSEGLTLGTHQSTFGKPPQCQR